ncbi:uncharacterized protein DMAD_11814 [Drosophila madeirensis]
MRSQLAAYVGRDDHSPDIEKRLAQLKAQYGAENTLKRKEDFTGDAQLLTTAVLSEKCFSKKGFSFSDERKTALSLIEGRVFAKVLMEGHSIVALLDTGSTRTIISERVAQELCTEQNRRNVHIRLALPDKSYTIVKQALMANVQLGTQQIQLLVLVLPSCKQENAILGMDFICRSDARIQLGGVSLELNSNQETLRASDSRVKENKMAAAPKPFAMEAPAGSLSHLDVWVVAPLEWRVNTRLRRLPVELRDRLVARLQKPKRKDVRYLTSACGHNFRVHINTQNQLSVHLRDETLNLV